MIRLNHQEMHICCIYLNTRFGHQSYRIRRRARRVVLRTMKRLAREDPAEKAKRVVFFIEYVNLTFAAERAAQEKAAGRLAAAGGTDLTAHVPRRRR